MTSKFEMIKMALCEAGYPQLAKVATTNDDDRCFFPRITLYNEEYCSVIEKAANMVHEVLGHDSHTADEHQGPGVCCHTCGRRESCIR